MKKRSEVGAALLTLLVAACVESEAGARTVIATPCVVDASRYAHAVASFEPGDGAGFGEDELPGVVIGPPAATPEGVGSLDVLSLGAGGAITLEFAAPIVDGAGVDFIVYENAFAIAGGGVFSELGSVGVSHDGVAFTWFSCDVETMAGCAGKTPTLPHEPCATHPLRVEATGGDGFDLATVGLSEVRFVRIEDASNAGSSPSAGFDLDAVGAVHLSPAH